MSDSNIIETLQAVQNERFAQGDSTPECGNAIFNDSVTVKAIEQELEKKRQEWRDLNGRTRSAAERVKKIEGMQKRSIMDEENLKNCRNYIQFTVPRMKQLEKEANELKAMSEEAKIQWTMQKRLQATIMQYTNVWTTIDRTGRELASKTRHSNFIPDNQLKRMSKTELEWLVAEATTVKPMIEKLNKDIDASEQLYRTIKPQRDQLKQAEIKRGGGTLPRTGDPALSELMIQARDIERSQIEMAKVKRAYGHIIEQGKRAKKVLDALPRETSVRNTSAMAAFQ